MSTDQIAKVVEAIGPIVGPILLTCAFILLLLTILMPVFVYLAAQYSRECRDELRRMNSHYTAALARKAQRNPPRQPD